MFLGRAPDRDFRLAPLVIFDTAMLFLVHGYRWFVPHVVPRIPAGQVVAKITTFHPAHQ